jgi:pimeloyl-ACP methyl ester carboxylesterase
MLALKQCQVNLIDKGSGSPILFLHGNPDSAHVWDAVMEPLSKSFRCIAPDLPGLGLSTATKDFDYSLDGLARFVDELISALGLETPLYIVGHDIGGAAALAWLARHPEKSKGVAVMNTSFFSDYKWHFWAHVWRLPLIGELSMATMNSFMFKQEMRRGSNALSSEFIAATYARLTPAVKKAILRLYRSIEAVNMPAWETAFLAAAKRVPIIVLWGDGDPYIPDAYADRFAARKVVRFANAGHWLPVVEANRVAQEINNFFKQAQPG